MKTRPKILHLSTVHTQPDTRIFYKQCKALSVAGFDVVLVGLDCELPPVAEGVKFVSLGRRRTRVMRSTLQAFRAYRVCLQENPVVVHLHDPELVWIAVLLRWRKCLIVFDAHEDLPGQVLSKHWIPSLLRVPAANLALLLEKLWSFVANAIVAATPAIALRFPDRKTWLVQNFPVVEEFIKGFSSISFADRDNIVAYVGGLNLSRGAQQMFDSLSAVPDALAPTLWIIGNIDVEARARLQDHSNIDRISCLGHMNRLEVAKLLSKSKIGLCLYLPTRNHVQAQPTKLFEYMAAGIPVICSDFPVWREYVQQTGCGFVVNPYDTMAVAEKVTWLLTHPDEAREMGKSGRKAIEESLNWDAEARSLLDLYSQLLYGHVS